MKKREILGVLILAAGSVLYVRETYFQKFPAPELKAIGGALIIIGGSMVVYDVFKSGRL